MARRPKPRIDPRDPVLTRIRDFLIWVEDTIDALQAAIDALDTGVSTHASTHIRGGTDQIDADLLDIDYSPTNYTRTTTAPATNVEHLTAHLAGLDTAVGSHASRHIRSGADEIDGDLLDVDYVPVYYTRSTTSPSTGTNNEHLGSHLAGLDIAVRDVSVPDFGNYYSPVGAWVLDANRTTDVSGNGRTLTPNGTLRLAASYTAGLLCTSFNNVNFLSSTSAGLNITGAWSGEAVVRCYGAATVTNGGAFVEWAGATEVEANNITWTIGRMASSGIIGGTYWEQAAAADVNISEHGLFPTDEWVHICQTRSSSGRFRTYLNGIQTAETVGLTMPTGGGTGRFSIGGANTTMQNPFLCQYVAIYSAELTAAEVLTLAKKRMAGRRV